MQPSSLARAFIIYTKLLWLPPMASATIRAASLALGSSMQYSRVRMVWVSPWRMSAWEAFLPYR